MGLLWFDAISMVFDPSNYVSPPVRSQPGSPNDPSSVLPGAAEQTEHPSTDTSSPDTHSHAEQSDTHSSTEPTGTTSPSTVPCANIAAEHSDSDESPVLHQTPSPNELSGTTPPSKVSRPPVLTISPFEKELFGTTSSTKILGTDVMKENSDSDALPVLSQTLKLSLPSQTELFRTAYSTNIPNTGDISNIITTGASTFLPDLPSQTELFGSSSPVKIPLTDVQAKYSGSDAAPVVQHFPSPAALSGTTSSSKVPLADVMAASPISDTAQLPQHNAAAADQQGSVLSSEQPGTSTIASSSQSRSPAIPPIPVTKGHTDSESQAIEIIVVDGVTQTHDLCCSVCGSEKIIVKPERPRQNTTSTVSSDVLKSEKTDNVVSATPSVSGTDKVDDAGETRDLKSDTITTVQNNIPPTYTVSSPVYTGNEETRQFGSEALYPPDNANKRSAPSSPDLQSDELCEIKGKKMEGTGENSSFRKFKIAKRESPNVPLESDEMFLGKSEKRTVRKRALVDNPVIGDCETSFKKRRSERRQYGGLFGPLPDQYLHESDPNPPIAIPAYADLASTLPRPVNHSRTHQVKRTPCYAPTSFSHPPCDPKTSAGSKSHTVTLSNFFTKAYTDLKSSSESKPHTATLTNFFAKPTTFLKTCETKPHTITLSDFAAQSPTSADTEETEHHENQAMDCLPSIKQEPITPEPSMQEFTQLNSVHEHKPDVYAPPRYYTQLFTDLASVKPTELVHEQTTHHNTDYTPARSFDGYLPPCASLHAGSSPADSHSQRLSEWEEDECDIEVECINAMKESSDDESTVHSPVTP